MQEPSHHRDFFFHIYRWFNLFLVILLPAYAVLNGLTTVFYILYLYWWHELISSSLDGFYFYLQQKRNPGAATANPVWGRFFMLGIYFVFIVVLFGFITDWGNTQLIVMNIRVLLLRDFYFVINLTCLLLNEWWLRHHYATKYNAAQQPFAGRMIVLHISILGGAVMYFWLLKEFPETFIPGNLWGSVIIATPFLLAKAILSWR
ncbi:MAG: hypothetical protein WCF67_16070 [Chitinophagaceae bacterium]